MADRVYPVVSLIRVSAAVALFVGAPGAVNAQMELSLGGAQMGQDENARMIPAYPDNVDDSLEAEARQRGKRGELVVAPLPGRNPVFGWNVTLPILYLYASPARNTDDGVWITGIGGFYSENGSQGLGAFHKMSLGGDRWRITAAILGADVKYDYYGIGGDGDGPKLPLSQSIDLYMGEALREIGRKLYFGVAVTSMQSEVALDISGGILPPELALPTAEINIVSLAPKLRYDTRDAEFYPRRGWYGTAKVTVGREGIGSDVDYEVYSAEMNHYRPLSDNGVLATRVVLKYAAGDAPFFVYPTYGSGADLRGYQTGAYRDRFLFAAQTEYRRKLSLRFGAALFVGIGTVSSQFGDWGPSLAAGGVGPRYTLAQQNNMNLRLDVARGRNETFVYVGRGEAF